MPKDSATPLCRRWDQWAAYQAALGYARSPGWRSVPGVHFYVGKQGGRWIVSVDWD